MNINDKLQFTQKLMSISTMYDKKITNHMVDMYFSLLANYSIELIARAIDSHMLDERSGQFFPKPADIVKHINSSVGTTALGAWLEVEQAMSRHGIYRNILFADTVITQTLRSMGGWTEVCSWLQKDMHFKQREFCERYTHYKSNADSDDDEPTALCGLFYKEEPVKVGDFSDKCNNVVRLTQKTNVKGLNSAVAAITKLTSAKT